MAHICMYFQVHRGILTFRRQYLEWGKTPSPLALKSGLGFKCILFSLCPQISARAMSPGQKWWPTVLEIEIHAGNEKAQHALMNDPVSFSFFLRWAGTRISSQ